MDLKQNVDELNAMILEGKALDAFEKFYADDVVMQENTGEPRHGKDLNRTYEAEFFSNIETFHGAEVKAVAVGDNVTMVEWFMHYTHKQYGEIKNTQVAVQRWNDAGQIVHERFYYGK